MPRQIGLAGWIVMTVLLCSVPARSAALAPSGLMVEFLRHSELAEIVDASPEFCWIVNSDEPNQVQTAYQIEVLASAPAGTGPAVWQPGPVTSDQSINVEYAGPALKPGASYVWRVRTWDRANRPSPWSSPQRFTMYDHARPFQPRQGYYRTPDNSFERTRFTVDRETELSKPLFVCTTSRSRLVTSTVAPRRIVNKGDGHYFIDFGVAWFGRLRIAFASPPHGGSFEVRLGERTDGDAVHMKPGGSIYRSSSSITIRDGQNVYYPDVQGGEKMPTGVSAVPFRCAEIIGCPVPVDESMVTLEAVHYVFDDDASAFKSSDQTLNDVWGMCRHTMQATTFCGMYVDGNRQRDPLHGDALINQLGQYCTDREYSMPRHSCEILINSQHWAAEWMMCSPLMAWRDYMYTGNKESIARHYEVLKLKTLHDLAGPDQLISPRIHRDFVDGWQSSLDAMVVSRIVDEAQRRAALARMALGQGISERVGNAKAKRSLSLWAQYALDRMDGKDKQPGQGDPENIIAWSGSRHVVDIIDWPGGERDGYDIVAVNTVPNAMHYGTLVTMERIADVLGKKGDAAFFRGRAEQVKRSINEKLFDTVRGVYVDGLGSTHASLHANMFPLAFGLVPESRTRTVVEFVKSRGMACSVYGAQYLLEALYMNGQAQHALDLMRSKGTRSWAHMIYDQGATMAMEAWDIRSKSNLDWNHPWGAAPANIIPRYLMGIRPLEPGFKTVLIKPQPGDLSLAECKMPTIRGPVKVRYERTDRGMVLDVTLPANMKATVGVPAMSSTSTSVVIDGAAVAGRLDGGHVMFEGIGSGTHVFRRDAN